MTDILFLTTWICTGLICILVMTAIDIRGKEFDLEYFDFEYWAMVFWMIIYGYLSLFVVMACIIVSHYQNIESLNFKTIICHTIHKIVNIGTKRKK